MNADSLSSLSLDQWMAEFDRLRKLNQEILRAPTQKQSATPERATTKRPRRKR